MNKVILSGNIVQDVTFKVNNNGNYSMLNKIAVTDNAKTDYEKTYFINIRVFKDELLEQFEEWGKGKLIEIEGKLVHENYQTEDGTWRNYTEVVVFNAEEIKFTQKQTKKDSKKGGFKPRKK